MKIKQLRGKNSLLRGSSQAAGYDLFYNPHVDFMFVNIEPNTHLVLETGISIEIPDGYFGMICSRSGLAAKHGLAVLNSPGIIDSDYTGELKVILANLSNQSFTIKPGDRIAQLVISKYEAIDLDIMDNPVIDTNTIRGEKGFGSTGI